MHKKTTKPKSYTYPNVPSSEGWITFTAASDEAAIAMVAYAPTNGAPMAELATYIGTRPVHVPLWRLEPSGEPGKSRGVPITNEAKVRPAPMRPTPRAR